MASLSPPPGTGIPIKPTYACIRCAERKVKCDRERPCRACVNHKADCIFQPPRPPSKRQRRVKEQLLADRLRYYETLLQERGIELSRPVAALDPDPRHGLNTAEIAVPTEVAHATPSSTVSEASGTASKARIIRGQGRSMLVDNILWSRVAEELHDPEDALETHSRDPSDAETSDDDFSFVLCSQPRTSTRPRHPSPGHIHQLWQTFVQNIDPLTKAVHAPTLEPAILKAACDTASIPRSFEALLFAIYSAAVMSLTDGECKDLLGESRRILLSRYTAATKAALSQARFMSTTSLVVLQALVLHLFSVRDIYEPRAVWSLTGVAIRIAQGMGLERDGACFGLAVFEAEMRRRIWWLLKTHDHKTAERCGLSKFRDVYMGSDSTKQPTNVDDDQLYPGMIALPEESKVLTDIAFVALRCELFSFATASAAKFQHEGQTASEWERTLASGDGGAEMDLALKKMEDHLEIKYLRYCDPSQPLHLLTMLMARSAVNTVRFLKHHPRRWASIEATPPSERHMVWEVCIKLLEQHSMLQSNPQLKQFAWHAACVMQWHAFIHLLDTLRADPLRRDADKAWRLIGSTYENNEAMTQDMKKPIHVAVASLCLKAYVARVAALAEYSATPTPGFISQLRQAQETARVKRRTRDAQPSRADNQVRPDGRATARDTGDGLGANIVRWPDAPLYAQNTAPTGINSDGDPTWPMTGLADSQCSPYDAMNMSTHLGLSQDGTVDANDFATVTWEQWDTWLAESSAMLTFSS